jgi:hypothetical protein
MKFYGKSLGDWRMSEELGPTTRHKLSRKREKKRQATRQRRLNKQACLEF